MQHVQDTILKLSLLYGQLLLWTFKHDVLLTVTTSDRQPLIHLLILISTRRYDVLLIYAFSGQLLPVKFAYFDFFQ